jgi:hypothetical protein
MASVLVNIEAQQHRRRLQRQSELLLKSDYTILQPATDKVWSSFSPCSASILLLVVIPLVSRVTYLRSLVDQP